MRVFSFFCMWKLDCEKSILQERKLRLLGETKEKSSHGLVCSSECLKSKQTLEPRNPHEEIGKKKNVVIQRIRAQISFALLFF